MRTIQVCQSLRLSSLMMRSVNQFASRIPVFSALRDQKGDQIKIVHSSNASDFLPAYKIKDFGQKKTVTCVNLTGEGANTRELTTKFYSENSWRKLKEISKTTSIDFSSEIKNSKNFYGIASQILTKGYKFSRKQKDQKQIELRVADIPDREYVFELAKAKIKAAEWANSRGNEANTAFILKQAERIASSYPGVKIKVIKGIQLLNQGFNLLHAVGRASDNEPLFISLEWKGAAQTDPFYGLVGKGLCFDAGGLNLKSTAGIAGMHGDKHGACSVLSAFQSSVATKTKLNIVAVLGVAQNFINSNSYRPLDIIKSRKGLTVQIGNTDAEGRLVLADCMNWVQQNYKIRTMIELSTLTGAISIALGKQRAGVFTNSDTLADQLYKTGEQIEEWNWHMPIDQYHEEMIKPKHADITNSAGKSDGSSCQAAAFLKNFVEPGVEWAHVDIAGASTIESGASGYGAKLIMHFLRNRLA